MAVRSVLMIATTLTFVTSGFGQNPIGRPTVPVPPEVQEKLEQQRQYREKMRKPDFLRVELAPGEDDQSEGKRVSYKVGEKILVRVILINNSPQSVQVPVTDTYYQNRPHLVRGAQPVEYRKDVTELIAAKEKDPTFFRINMWELEPLEPHAVETINLNDWYEPLARGVYRLTLKHRFVDGGDWLDSAPLILVIE